MGEAVVILEARIQELEHGREMCFLLKRKFFPSLSWSMDNFLNNPLQVFIFGVDNSPEQ